VAPKPQSLATWTPIVVTWRDAFSPSGQKSRLFVDPEHKIEKCIRRTAGFLLRDDADVVVVCMEDDRGARDAVETEDDIENVTVIPKCMVVKIASFEAPPARRK
jgi:hypothetical protein